MSAFGQKGTFDQAQKPRTRRGFSGNLLKKETYWRARSFIRVLIAMIEVLK